MNDDWDIRHDKDGDVFYIRRRKKPCYYYRFLDGSQTKLKASSDSANSMNRRPSLGLSCLEQSCSA